MTSHERSTEGMTDTEVLMAGFGGQGMLLAGKVLAQASMEIGREVSWLPSYGPEMRGGTANVIVCIASTPIGSPLIEQPARAHRHEPAVAREVRAEGEARRRHRRQRIAHRARSARATTAVVIKVRRARARAGGGRRRAPPTS